MANTRLKLKNCETIVCLDFYADQVLKNQAKLWQERKWCDVILISGDKVKCVKKLDIICV